MNHLYRRKKNLNINRKNCSKGLVMDAITYKYSHIEKKPLTGDTFWFFNKDKNTVVEVW